MVATVGDLVAPLIGVERPGEIVFQPNVTIAHAVILSALSFQERPKIVTDAMHFPSILYLLEEQRRHGAEIVVIPTDDGLSVGAGRIVEAIDERTAAVAVSHVLFKSAFIQDVGAICERASQAGALSILDGYQAVGSIPVDVKTIGADVYIGGCLKWLCGGPGAAFLWVRPERAGKLTPSLTGWMAHERPFGFSPQLERRGDAWRFLHGTPNIPALYAARPGLEIVAEAGIESIRAKSIRQTERLIGLARERGFRVVAPERSEQRGGTVAVDVEHGAEVSRALKARDVLCDYRPGAGIRLSPHFYTRDEELEGAIETLGAILRDGSWRAFAGSAPTVT
jgi:kynureninase